MFQARKYNDEWGGGNMLVFFFQAELDVSLHVAGKNILGRITGNSGTEFTILDLYVVGVLSFEAHAARLLKLLRVLAQIHEIPVVGQFLVFLKFLREKVASVFLPAGILLSISEDQHDVLLLVFETIKGFDHGFIQSGFPFRDVILACKLRGMFQGNTFPNNFHLAIEGDQSDNSFVVGKFLLEEKEKRDKKRLK